MTCTKADHEDLKERCRQLFARLSDFIDGDVDDSICEELETVKQECPTCIGPFLETLERTISLFREYSGSEIESVERRRLHDRLMKTVQQSRHTGPS